MKVIYKITYPNGGTYIGQDHLRLNDPNMSCNRYRNSKNRWVHSILVSDRRFLLVM